MQTPAHINIPPPSYIPASNVPEWVAPFLAILMLIGVGAWLLMPLIRAWAKRIEGHGADPAVMEELAQLRERVAELERRDAHVAELAERLDFAERLLAQRIDEPRLPLHRTPV